MPVVATLPKLAIPSGGFQLWPNGLGAALKPLSIGVGPIQDPLADIKKEIGQAVRSLLADLQVSVPRHTPFTLAR